MVKSIRILLAIAAYLDYEILHMDVKTAFLNGNLTEVYMTQPKRFTFEDSSEVCKAFKIHLWIKAGIPELEYPF